MNLSKLKIVVFGGTGLVGSSLVKKLKLSNYFFVAPKRNEIDLFMYSEVCKFIKDIKPDLVINCAGKVGGIAINNDNHFEFFNKNFDIGRNIINSCIENNIYNLINLGSSCMYPTHIIENQLAEKDILSGPLEKTNEGYALAKISILKLCTYLNKEKNTNFKTFIPCNLYGPNDKFDLYSSHLIPAIINKVHHAISEKKQFIEIWGSGKVKREFMFSDDLSDFIVFSINNWQKVPAVINVGMGKDLTVTDYYKIISETLGWNGKFIYDKNKPEGMKNKLMNITLLKELGWKPKFDLISGINLTYKSYKDKIDKVN